MLIAKMSKSGWKYIIIVLLSICVIIGVESCEIWVSCIKGQRYIIRKVKQMKQITKKRKMKKKKGKKNVPVVMA